MKKFWEFQTVKWEKWESLNICYCERYYLDLILATLYFDEHVKFQWAFIPYSLYSHEFCLQAWNDLFGNKPHENFASAGIGVHLCTGNLHGVRLRNWDSSVHCNKNNNYCFVFIKNNNIIIIVIFILIIITIIVIFYQNKKCLL